MKYIFPFLLLFSACGETPSTKEKNNQTFIIVTHNLELANMTQKKLEMVDGKFIS